MKKVLLIFGTRPEAIKLCPIILEIKKYPGLFSVVVCVTGQHKEMLEQVLKTFNIIPEYNLKLMRKNQSLFELTSTSLIKIGDVLEKENPKLVLVQGDTTTAFTAALAAFYRKIPVAHIEAGLRSGNNYSPFPEEMNRKITSLITRYHFAPTKLNKKNLMREGISKENVFVTGNTVIDSLLWVRDKINRENLTYKELSSININKKIILVTGHRRENFGVKLDNICKALKIIAGKYDVEIVYPVHLNPNVTKCVYAILNNINNIKLIPPLDYEPFVYLMDKCSLIITDSGGIQEEAPTLRKHILVTREVTERKEVIEKGLALLVGTDTKNIVKNVSRIMNNITIHDKSHRVSNPYGDGNSSKRIVNILKNLDI